MSESDLKHRDDGFASFDIVDARKPQGRFVCSKDELFDHKGVVSPVISE